MCYRNNGKFKTAIVDDRDHCPVLAEHPDLECNIRYAIYVFDRADGKLKVMEGGPSVFKPIAKRCEATNVNPGGHDGGDWLIEVTGIGLSKRYSVTYLTQTPFTEEELEIIKAEVYGDKNKLAKLYA